MSTEALATRVAHTLGERLGTAVRIDALEPLAGGACQDNYRVDAHVGGEPLRLALRSDAKRSLAGSLGRAEEFAVVEHAVAAGVKTPRARWLTHGLVRDGASAYFLDWVTGEAIGRRVVRNADLAHARATLADELAANLARIHTVTPSSAPALALANSPPEALRDPVGGALAFVRAMLDTLPDARPALAYALRWLETHRPAPAPVVLVHGDYRTGNFMVAPDGLRAVLDWEFAHWGNAAEDLGWISVRDWRFGQLDLPVGGFAKCEPFVRAYENASGNAVDRDAVHWWEVMGNVRWAAGSVQQGERYLSGEEQDLELIAIARRAVEMEWEALRLIDRGATKG